MSCWLRLIVWTKVSAIASPTSRRFSLERMMSFPKQWPARPRLPRLATTPRSTMKRAVHGTRSSRQ